MTTIRTPSPREVLFERLGQESWPIHLEVVKVERYDLTDPPRARAFGRIEGTLRAQDAHYHRYVKAVAMPADLLKHMDLPITDTPMTNTWSIEFGFMPSEGQSSPVKTRNMRALVGTSWNMAELIGYDVVIGCRHEMDTRGSNPRRGYHVGTCTRCGHAYVCDSGD